MCAPVRVAHEEFAVPVFQLEQASSAAGPPGMCLLEPFDGHAELPGDGADLL